MKKISVFLTAIMMLSAVVAAQENSSANTVTPAKIVGQKAVVVLDTHNKTGYLVYKEEYYTVSRNGSLQFEAGRIFYKGYVNITKIKLQIIRPLDKYGNPYNEFGIKAIVTLDNNTILNSWYQRRETNVNKSVNSTDNTTTPSETKKSPGFGGVISLVTLVGLALLGINRYRRDKGS